MNLAAILGLAVVVVLTLLVLAGLRRRAPQLESSAHAARELDLASPLPPPTHVACEHCGKLFTSRGMTRHVNAAHARGNGPRSGEAAEARP